MLLIAGVYLLFLLFGGTLRDSSAISAADRRHLASVLSYCEVAMRWAGIAVAVGLVVRFIDTERVGHLMTLAGVAAYFGLPALFEYWKGTNLEQGDYFAVRILTSLCSVGMIFLLTGLWHVLYNNMLRIWRSVQARQQVGMVASRGVVPRKRGRRPSILTPCWHMDFCRDSVRESCPIYRKRVSCWRLKTGCMCDEHYVRGVASKLKPSVAEGGPGPGVDPKLWAKLKRERCRRCPIYAERQSAKYRALIPLVAAVVGLAFYLSYGRIAGLVFEGAQRADRFFAFMARVTVSVELPSGGVEAMTAFIMVWLGVVALCYAIRGLEYLIFELQV